MGWRQGNNANTRKGGARVEREEVGDLIIRD
jgi:hypothetical protein